MGGATAVSKDALSAADGALAKVDDALVSVREVCATMCDVVCPTLDACMQTLRMVRGMLLEEADAGEVRMQSVRTAGEIDALIGVISAFKGGGEVA